jgi:hypothetical protein
LNFNIHAHKKVPKNVIFARQKQAWRLLCTFGFNIFQYGKRSFMKKVILALVVGVAGQFASAQVNNQCPQDIDCSGLTFSWTPSGGMQLTSSPGNHDELSVSVCGVRQLCPANSIDNDGQIAVDPTLVRLPEGLQDTQEIRQNLADDCARAIPSQLSNACYSSHVWQGNAGDLYNR